MPDFYCDQILSGALKVEVLEESPHVLAFNHTRPYWPVHIVVIPKTHIESIGALSAEHQPMVLDAMRIISRLAARVRAEHGGCRISTNVGEYQSSRHLHWYIHAGRRIRDEAGVSPAHRLPEHFETERLVLRAPRASDARSLFDGYTQDAEVARYMIWRPHTSLAETEEFIAGCIRDWPDGTRLPYVLVLRDAPERVIGMLEARPRSCIIDFGYVLRRAQWGNGLMPEAIRAFAAAALRIPEVFRLQATCDVDNRASARALEKSGFSLEGQLERYIVHPNISSEPRPCFMYARCR